MIDVLRKSGTNTEQKRAIEICLKMSHFCLIQGFPGSGKSKVICVLLEAFLRMGKTVLLTAHTHSAVDNVLSRLLKRLKESEKKTIVRLGADQKMDLSVRPFAEKNLFDGITRNAELIKLYKSKRLICGTCMGVARHDIFMHVKPDICIIDEAGQVSEPIVLGPLFHCSKFILVGDPKQLPPLIRSRKARALDADISLMERLCDSHPKLVRKLNRQYRFNQEINDISSELVYDGEMKPDPSVAETLLISQVGTPSGKSQQPKWLSDAVNPEKSVTWIDTSGT